MPTAKKVTKETTSKKRTAAKKSTADVVANSPAKSDKLQLNPLKLESLPKRTKLILLGIICVILVGVILFINKSLFVAVLVNGEIISRVEVIGELEKQQGATIINRLIDKKLILQEATKQNLSPTQEEIDAKRKEIIDQVSDGNEENFTQILEAQGLTSEDFSAELAIQIVAEKLLSKEIEVTDEEFNQFIESNPDLMENAENKEEVEAQLREQLKQQKLQTEYNTWMEKLRTQADIVRFVDY